MPLFGPTLLADLTTDVPEDFQPYPGYESPDGKVAKATQEELLLWIHSDEKGLCWEAQFRFRNAVAGHMTVARETPTFIYRNSLDLTGFIDGTGNPAPEEQHDRAIVPEGKGRRGWVVLHRAAMGPRSHIFRGPLANRPREHIRTSQGRLRTLGDPGTDLTSEPCRAARGNYSRREQAQAR